MHRQKTKKEIIAELMLKSAEKPLTPEEIISIGRRGKEDRNIQIGQSIALGLVLVALYKSYGWEKNDLLQLIMMFWEYLHTYQSGKKEDVDLTLKYFEELYELTGYNVQDGGNSLWEKVQKGEVKVNDGN